MTVENDGAPDVLELRLLRPERWIRDKGATEGAVIGVALDDLNVAGHARVTKVGTAGHVAPGSRCPVTGWVRHTSHDVISVALEEDETLNLTRHHRLFSEDRGDWVRAGDLEVGEALRTKDGVAHTRSVGGFVPQAVEVFNLEVLGAHRYFVGELGVLAHNMYGAAEGGEAMTTLYRGVMPEELADIQETGQLINRGSAEGKYFSLDPEGVSSYAKQAVNGFGDPPYTMVQTQIPTRLLTPEMGAVVDRGVNAVVVPNALLPGLTPTVSPFMVVP